jgi:hypothetical protein
VCCDGQDWQTRQADKQAPLSSEPSQHRYDVARWQEQQAGRRDPAADTNSLCTTQPPRLPMYSKEEWEEEESCSAQPSRACAELRERLQGCLQSAARVAAPPVLPLVCSWCHFPPHARLEGA